MSSFQTQPLITQQSYQQSKQPVIQRQNKFIARKEDGQGRQQPDWKPRANKKASQQTISGVKSSSDPLKGSITEQNFFQVMDLVDEYDQLLKQMNELYTESMLAIANVKFINPYTSLSTKGYKPTPAITKVCINPQNKKRITKTSKQCPQFKSDQNCNDDDNWPVNKVQRSFELTQQKDIHFTYSVLDQFTRQNRIAGQSQNQDERHTINEEAQFSEQVDSSLSTAHQLYTYDEEELILEEESIVADCQKLYGQTFSKQQFLLERFSISSQKPAVMQAANKFKSLLGKLLEIAKAKLKTEAMLSEFSPKLNNHTNDQ